MGRYSEYFKEIWKIQGNRKVLGISIFGTIIDNSKPFKPGDQLKIYPETETALQTLIKKGYDFVIITGQPSLRSKNLEIQDFENILSSIKEIIVNLGGNIKNAYYAPNTDRNDPYVKPNPGMFERAQKEGMIKWDETFFIGSDMNDVKAATKVKTTPILINNSNNVKTKAFELTNQVKVKEFNSLLEFANSL